METNTVKIFAITKRIYISHVPHIPDITISANRKAVGMTNKSCLQMDIITRIALMQSRFVFPDKPKMPASGVENTSNPTNADAIWPITVA
jgi:hypothetical protein